MHWECYLATQVLHQPVTFQSTSLAVTYRGSRWWQACDSTEGTVFEHNTASKARCCLAKKQIVRDSETVQVYLSDEEFPQVQPSFYLEISHR